MADFDPKAYVSDGGFDPKAYLAEGAPKGKRGNARGAALEHFGNAATLGYLPQLQAGIEQLIPNPNASLDEKLRSEGFTVEQPSESYVQSRDANIERMAQQKADFPAASKLGTVAGIVSSIPLYGAAGKALGVGGKLNALMPGKLAEGASVLQKLAHMGQTIGARAAQGAATGAGMAAVANPGDVEGEIDASLQIPERFENAKTGAKWGAGLGAGFAAAPYLAKGASVATKKVVARVSGISDQDLSRYAQKTDEINKMIKESGGNMTEAADKLREQTQSAIRAKRQELSNTLTQSLEAAPKKVSIDASPVVKTLEAAKEKLDPLFHKEAIGQIDAMIAQVKQGLVPETQAYAKFAGQTNAKYLHLIKEYLQGKAKSSYMENGQIFVAAPQAAQAAKSAAAISRKIFNQAVPEGAKANNQLSYLHNLENQLNKNLIAPGKTDSALFAAGSGANPRNARMLEKLSEVSGFPLAEKAQNLATARTFNDPSFMSNYGTGRSLLGTATGFGLSGGNPVGAAVGAALSSPAAVKLAINAGNVGSKVASRIGDTRLSKELGNLMQKNPKAAEQVAGFLGLGGAKFTEQEVDPNTIDFFRQNKQLLDNIQDNVLRAKIQKEMNREPSSMKRRLAR